MKILSLNLTLHLFQISICHIHMYTSNKFLIIKIGNVAMPCQRKLTSMTKIEDFYSIIFFKRLKMKVKIFIEPKNIFNSFLNHVVITFVKR